MAYRPESSQHTFAQVASTSQRRSAFNRSHGIKTTFDAGQLIPFFVDETLPGDEFKLRATLFSRMATPIHPVMDNIYLDTHFFFVPYRIIWDNWEKFQGAQDNPGDSIDFQIPGMISETVNGHLAGSLADYFGIPTLIPDLPHSALFHRAYNRIYTDWFRDQNLIDSPANPTHDGPDWWFDYPVQKRAKRHDYFTSALPWTQKGPDVTLPLGTSAPVVSEGTVVGAPVGLPRFQEGGPSGSSYQLRTDTPTTYNAAFDGTPNGNNLMYWNTGGSGIGLEADLRGAAASNMNDFRLAFATQSLLEKDARGGTRYVEQLLSHWGVVSPDHRLQRPEYLGGGTQRINISQVPQTSSTDATTPQGNVAAYAISTGSNHSFRKSFVEHGIVMGLVSARADLTYQQGLNRMFSRSKRFDFYMPSFAHLGEQPILLKELYAKGTVNDDLVFGYQEAWSEYRYKPSLVTGEMRSNHATPLDSWHLAQDFGGEPALNQSFIEENPPIDRVVAVPTSPDFILDGFMDYRCVRPMPVYSVPGLAGHF